MPVYRADTPKTTLLRYAPVVRSSFREGSGGFRRVPEGSRVAVGDTSSARIAQKHALQRAGFITCPQSLTGKGINEPLSSL